PSPASTHTPAAPARAIFDGLPDPLIAVDRSRRIVRTNLAARELLGSASAERDLSTMFRQPQLLAAIDGLLDTADGNFTGPDQTGVEFVLPGPPELDMVAHLRRLPRAAADGSLAPMRVADTQPPPRPAPRPAGPDRPARHHGAAPRRAHARRLRRQCQPRAQDADRGPRRLH